VAIIGGLTSGLGIIVGGIILGVAETTTGFYISTGYKDVPGLVLLLLVLANVSRKRQLGLQQVVLVNLLRQLPLSQVNWRLAQVLGRVVLSEKSTTRTARMAA
jgi:hypothetical protein